MYPQLARLYVFLLVMQTMQACVSGMIKQRRRFTGSPGQRANPIVVTSMGQMQVSV